MKIKNLMAIVALVVFAYAITNIMGGIKAFAFSTITPIQASAPATNAANITGSGTNIQPWFAVGVGAYDGPNSYAKVYVPKGTSATLTVSQGNGVCGIDVGNPVVNYTVTRLDNAETVLGNGSLVGSKSNIGGCGSLTFTLSGGTAATQLVGHQNYDVYYFEAIMTNGSGSGDNEKNFRLSVSNGLVGVSRPVKNYGAKPWFGIYMRDAPSRGGNNWDYGVQFSPYCNESSGSTRSVAVHDIDWQVYNQPSLTGLVDKDDRGASGYNWNLAPPGEPTSKKVTNEWPSGNDTDANLSFTYDNSFRYLLEFKDIDWHNTIQISLPFDEFDSQPAVGQACAGSSKPIVSCSAQPGNQTVNQNVQAAITITGTSNHTWKSSYYIKRTGPSYKNFPSGKTATDNVSYTGTTPVTYTYIVFDSSTNTQISAGNCTAVVNWTNQKIPGVSCTATPTNSNPGIGTPTSINFTITNNGTTNLQGDQVRQKASDSANTGAVWPQSGFGNFSNGQTASFTFPVSARGSAKVVTFTYTLFSGTNAGDPPVVGVKNPLPCSATITWGSCGPGGCNGGNLQITCSQTTVPGMTSTATYQHAVVTQTQPPSYFTIASPNTWASYPYPPGPPVAPPLVIVNGTYGVDYWTYKPPLQTTTTYVTQPATEIPIQIRFDDGSVYSTVIPGNPSSPYSLDTFNTMTFLRPHLSYGATLYAQTSGDLGPEQNGPYGNWTQIGQPQSLGQCLKAEANACIGGDSPVAAPGSPVQSTYRITLTNTTNRNFDTGVGYNLLAHPDGQGLLPNGNMSQAVSIPPGQNTISATFSFITNYQGTYWVEFRYQGNTVNNLLDNAGNQSWPGTCGSGGDNTPPVSITPQVAPYFQVWQNDAAGGGGFRTIDFQCPNSYPAYVSPPTRGGSNLAGGIRAMSGSLQSKSDFGAVAMGLIPNPSGEGFYVRNTGGKNIYFANNGVPSLGGYLNSTSSNHCVDDYYTNTQVDPSNTPTLGDLESDIASCPIDTNTNSSRCQFQTNSTTISGNILITTGHQITVYVNGNVKIDANITYDEPFNPNDRSSIPYFAIIAKGNITLTNNVTRLDGLYVAQPSGGGTGVFATCDSVCGNQLVINGAVIAQHVELLRSHGSDQALNPDVNGIGTNPAEIINFVPSMILGAPMFNPQPITPEGLFSLSPVF